MGMFLSVILSVLCYSKALATTINSLEEMPLEIRRRVFSHLDHQDFMSVRHSCKGIYKASNFMLERRKFKLKRLDNLSKSLEAIVHAQVFFKKITIIGPLVESNQLSIQSWKNFFSELTVQKLYLDNLGITGKCLEGFINNRTCNNLSIKHNLISPKDINYIRFFLESPNNFLVSLKLSYNPLGDKGIEFLSKGIKHHQYMKHLELDYCYISNQGAKNIAKVLCKNNTLQFLSLNYNYIGDRGILAISKSLKLNKYLTTLHIQSNQIKNQGVYCLLKTILDNSIVRNLNVAENQIDIFGIFICKRMIKNKDQFLVKGLEEY